MTWKPIDTAPRDGTDVLLFFPKTDAVAVGHFVDAADMKYGKVVRERKYWFTGILLGMGTTEDAPSHWREIDRPVREMRPNETI